MPTDKPVTFSLALADSHAAWPLTRRLLHDDEAFLPHVHEFFLTQIGTEYGPPRHQRRRPLSKFVVLSEPQQGVIVVLGDLIWWWLTPHVIMPFINHHHP